MNLLYLAFRHCRTAYDRGVFPVKTCKIVRKDQDRLNRLITKMTMPIKELGDYNPPFDNPLIETIAKSIIYTKKAEICRGQEAKH